MGVLRKYLVENFGALVTGALLTTTDGAGSTTRFLHCHEHGHDHGLVVGLVAGVWASVAMRGWASGLFGNIILGIAGALLGGWGFRELG